MKKYTFVFVCLVTLLGIAWAKTPPAKTFKAPQNAEMRNNQQNAAITFNGKKFYLQYSVGNDQQMWLNEYLPTGSNFNNYTEMIALRSYENSKATPQQIAQMIAGNFTKQYPGVKFLLAANDKTGDGLVSFIMVQGNILEHNIYRTTTKGGTPISLQYVYRKYCQDGEQRQACMSAFSQEVRTRRTEWINALDGMPVPSVVRTVKQ